MGAHFSMHRFLAFFEEINSKYVFFKMSCAFVYTSTAYFMTSRKHLPKAFSGIQSNYFLNPCGIFQEFSDILRDP